MSHLIPQPTYAFISLVAAKPFEVLTSGKLFKDIADDAHGSRTASFAHRTLRRTRSLNAHHPRSSPHDRANSPRLANSAELGLHPHHPRVSNNSSLCDLLQPTVASQANMKANAAAYEAHAEELAPQTHTVLVLALVHLVKTSVPTGERDDFVLVMGDEKTNLISSASSRQFLVLHRKDILLGKIQ